MPQGRPQKQWMTYAQEGVDVEDIRLRHTLAPFVERGWLRLKVMVDFGLVPLGGCAVWVAHCDRRDVDEISKT